MPQLKIATFNFENLFSRARALNLQSNQDTQVILGLLAEFEKLLKKSAYTAADKRRILELYHGTDSNAELGLKNWIEIEVTRGKLFSKRGQAIVGVKAGGKGEWNGVIQLKRAELNETAIANSALVVKAVKADILCLVEVENLPAVRNFRTDQLSPRSYPHAMVLDGNDPRGIDVGVLSRYPIHLMRSHIDEKARNGKPLFSRDCLELEILLPDGRSLWLLANHLKSKMGGDPPDARARRKEQAARIAEILQEYDLSRDLVVVAGDLNDTPESDPLSPLRAVPHLHDVLEVMHGADISKRWTYHYESNEQIDYLLVSKPLKDALTSAGVERRGIYGVETHSGGAIQPFDTITHWTHAASDHGAVWATFDI